MNVSKIMMACLMMFAFTAVNAQGNTSVDGGKPTDNAGHLGFGQVKYRVKTKISNKISEKAPQPAQSKK